MLNHSAFVNEHNEVTILCTNCGKKKVVNTDHLGAYVTRIKVKCQCGSFFLVTFERRKQYRKKVELSGHFSVTGRHEETGGMVVVDISRTGIGFETLACNTLQPGDTLIVKFTLDDAHATVITRSVTVRRTSGRFIGAEFCDKNLGKALGFYLMP